MRRILTRSRPMRQPSYFFSTEALQEKVQNKLTAAENSKAPLTHQSFSGRKRFYKQLGVKQVDTDKFSIELDGRTLRTPARNNLHLPTYSLALSIAAEWDSQTDECRGIEPVTMPMMTLASTALDQVAADPLHTIHTCLKYLHSDSALYFTHDQDRILLNKQRQFLSPAVEKVNSSAGTRLAITREMAKKITHSPEDIRRIESILHQMDHFTLACLQSATMECKSIILALALVGGLLPLEHVKVASRIEEEFQVEIWGVVEGGHDMDRLNNSIGLSSTHTFMRLLNRQVSFSKIN